VNFNKIFDVNPLKSTKNHFPLSRYFGGEKRVAVCLVLAPGRKDNYAKRLLAIKPAVNELKKVFKNTKFLIQ